jgi:hypothetical protein
VRWREQHLQLRCVLPFAIASAASGKRRLILAARAVNAFLFYTRFDYERLPELVAGRQPGVGIGAGDLTAGSNHAYMAPALWRLCVLSWAG